MHGKRWEIRDDLTVRNACFKTTVIEAKSETAMIPPY